MIKKAMVAGLLDVKNAESCILERVQELVSSWRPAGGCRWQQK